jgi:predicted N-acetyltransferase YhbS
VLPFVVVLGDPDFYRHFEFQEASLRGLRNEYGVDDPFMVLELRSGLLPPGAGMMVRYAPESAG